MSSSSSVSELKFVPEPGSLAETRSGTDVRVATETEVETKREAAPPPPPPQEKDVSSFVFCNKTRLYILIISLLCLTFSQMNSLTFNFTVICMNDVLENHYSTNTTDLHWLERAPHKPLLFSGAAIGGLLGLIPAVPLITRLGIRTTLTSSGLISATGSIFFPLAVSFSFYAALLCRILQGVGVSILFIVMGVIPGNWAPNSEASTFLAILSCALQLSNIISMPVSGILCESSLGWPSIYYIFGGATYIIFLVFFLTYRDTPQLHRNVSPKELAKISEGKVQKEKETVPYGSICVDLCVLTAWVSCTGGNIGFFVLSLYGPTYLREVVNLDIRETGFISALPFVLSIVFKFLAGQLSDRMTFVSEKGRFVFFAVVSQIGLAAGFVVMALTSSRVVAQGAFIFSIVAAGLNILGTIKCLQLRCRQYVSFAIAVISLTAYLVQFVAPIAVALVCPDNTPQQWCKLFISVAVCVVVLNAPFPFLTTSKPASYVSMEIAPKIVKRNEKIDEVSVSEVAQINR